MLAKGGQLGGESKTYGADDLDGLGIEACSGKRAPEENSSKSK